MDLAFQLGFAPLLTAVLAALACALPGNFLILRKQALVGDAISHVVLPGIVVAFLVTGSVAVWPMLLGAGFAALVSVAIVEVLRRVARLEGGAALGIVFTMMFALGVLLLERSDASGVHLDVQHALYGNLESIIWFEAATPLSLFSAEVWQGLPPQISRLAIMLAVLVGFVVVFWRDLALSTFDEGFAASLGLPVKRVGLALIVLVAATAVCAFDAVGAIIVIAMFVCPPATARLFTNQLKTQVMLSLVFAFLSAVIGYGAASFAPELFGAPKALNAAGTIAFVSGLFLGGAVAFGPERRSNKLA